MTGLRIPLPMAFVTVAIVFAMSACFFFIDDERDFKTNQVQPQNTTSKYAANARFKLAFLVIQDARPNALDLYEQVAHATVEALDTSGVEELALWHKRGQMKVALKVSDVEELTERINRAREIGLNAGMIDERIGYVGVAEVDSINQICGDLKLL